MAEISDSLLTFGMSRILGFDIGRTADQADRQHDLAAYGAIGYGRIANCPCRALALHRAASLLRKVPTVRRKSKDIA